MRVLILVALALPAIASGAAGDVQQCALGVRVCAFAEDYDGCDDFAASGVAIDWSPVRAHAVAWQGCEGGYESRGAALGVAPAAFEWRESGSGSSYRCSVEVQAAVDDVSASCALP